MWLVFVRHKLKIQKPSNMNGPDIFTFDISLLLVVNRILYNIR